jgi:DeoR-like helix-turn-helix domain/DeoR C terminal sensor domain
LELGLRQRQASGVKGEPVAGDDTSLDVDPAAGQTAPRERREQIRKLVVDEGFVRIEDLAETYGVSIMTIHRDLDTLQTEGWLRKVRGGATARPSAQYHGDVRHRIEAMADIKQLLARTALDLVEPGQAVMVDESTTGLALAELLPNKSPLTVITNFLAIVNRLAGGPGSTSSRSVAPTSPPTTRSSACGPTRRSDHCARTYCSCPRRP